MRRVMNLLLLAVSLLVPLNAQTYEPTWDSVDKRPIPARFSDAKFGIFIHWGTYSVPSYAPVIPGKLTYAEWYWNAMINGRNNPNADELQKGTWAFHQKVYGEVCEVSLCVTEQPSNAVAEQGTGVTLWRR